MEGTKPFGYKSSFVNSFMIHVHESLNFPLCNQLPLLHFVKFIPCLFKLSFEPLKSRIALFLRSSDVNDFNRILNSYGFTFPLG
jgi:hypothetical protein